MNKRLLKQVLEGLPEKQAEQLLKNLGHSGPLYSKKEVSKILSNLPIEVVRKIETQLEIEPEVEYVLVEDDDDISNYDYVNGNFIRKY